jgi:hypothetical protein
LALFVQAYCPDGLCLACGKPPTENNPWTFGHIHSHEDDGEATLENIQPLCKSCNAKHQHKDMPDFRPAEWFDTLIKLILLRSRRQIVVKQGCTDVAGNEQVCTDVAGTRAVESKRVIDLKTVVFETSNVLRTDLKTSVQTSGETVRARLDAMIAEGLKYGIAPPDPDCQDRIWPYIKNRYDDFLLACNAFLAWRSALDSAYDRSHATWSTFMDGFGSFLTDGRAEVNGALARQREQAEMDAWSARLAAQDAAREKEREQARRMNTCRVVAAMIVWPDITAKELETVEQCRALSGEQVPDALFEQAQAIEKAARACRDRKLALQARLNAVENILGQGVEDWHIESRRVLEALRAEVERIVTDTTSLAVCKENVEALLADIIRQLNARRLELAPLEEDDELSRLLSGKRPDDSLPQ